MCIKFLPSFLLRASSNKSMLKSKNWKVRKEISQVWYGEMASLLMMARHPDSEVLSHEICSPVKLESSRDSSSTGINNTKTKN